MHLTGCSCAATPETGLFSSPLNLCIHSAQVLIRRLLRAFSPPIPQSQGSYEKEER